MGLVLALLHAPATCSSAGSLMSEQGYDVLGKVIVIRLVKLAMRCILTLEYVLELSEI